MRSPRLQLINFSFEQLTLPLVITVLQSVVNQYSIDGENAVLSLSFVEDTLTAVVPVSFSDLIKVTQKLKESLNSQYKLEVTYHVVGNSYRIYVKGFQSCHS